MARRLDDDAGAWLVHHRLGLYKVGYFEEDFEADMSPVPDANEFANVNFMESAHKNILRTSIPIKYGAA